MRFVFNFVFNYAMAALEFDRDDYRDEADAHWRFSPYRGQHANMHLCEAMIAAHQATGEARSLADHVTRRQARLAGGLVWEHHDAHWNVDGD